MSFAIGNKNAEQKSKQKSNGAKKKRFDTPFTTEQEVWIVKQFHCGLSPIEVKRAFRKEHGLSRKIMNVQPRQFKSFLSHIYILHYIYLTRL